MGIVALPSKPRQHNAAPGDWLEAALAPWMAQIGAAPGENLLSLALDLPDALFDLVRNGRADRVWIAPDEEMFSVGAVAGFADMSVDRWRVACRRWTRFGDGPAPIAFLTAPPAPLGGGAHLSLPELLLRRSEGRCSLVLTGYRDFRPAAALTREWAERFRAMTAPAAKETHSPVERQEDRPDRAEWRARVRAATQAIRAKRFDKVVLARKRVVTLRAPIDADALARRMAQGCVEGRVLKFPSANGCTLAATPELLAVKRGRALVSHALAGTAPRFPTTAQDDETARTLRGCAKERREHALVVQSIAESMREICDELSHPPEPGLVKLPRLQHLWTPVSGHMREGLDLLDAIAALHPTPAVLGWPKAPARAFLRENEERRDGLYTGLAGWIDAEGDGEAAVVLRCAEIQGREARLWAGAGIMAESDPDAEWAETELKLTTFLDILGGAPSAEPRAREQSRHG
ncbi:isochorismate synthase [Rhodoblastus acidophilus]|uniref:isochorismate synthase n=1 Tax=Rhodoblastus acidophilus TaxID=1074 RepID=A0A212R3R6_RHOAC|nr:isochorismate synthase [Rhodoblastus acidophilus]PPQ40250.1 isochorismate synthase [Rhodoblastus acidophilus]RAI19345.1 isochorismate synthase [Rhodoblastus acidophilus]SNB66566.1 isochorismate synthase [Rhodoblastus acidophilus]